MTRLEHKLKQRKNNDLIELFYMFQVKAFEVGIYSICLTKTFFDNNSCKFHASEKI